MMIDLTIVSIYTLCTSVLGAGAHILTLRDIAKIKKTLKMQRMELVGLEAVSLTSLVLGVVEHKMYKKSYDKYEQNLSQTAYNLDQRINELMDRVNNIDLSTIQLKQDAILNEMRDLNSKTNHESNKKTNDDDNTTTQEK